jgi:hypothetical protein
MSTINFGTTVTLKQAAQMIAACPNNRFFLQGEPGIGKSSILPSIVSSLTQITGLEYHAAYVDVSQLDLGDIGYPAMDHESRVARFYPNARFGIHTGKPVVIMLDEFTKGMEPVKNMLHPLLEISNPRLGDIPLPEGSIVFLTGNLASDGVGDSLKAHTRNRITTLHVRKPESDEWLEWASTNEIEPTVMAWVRQFPHSMASYLDDGQDENPYIYHPKKMQPAFVSPRSLALASRIVAKRDQFNSDALIAGLKGTIGEAAARDMEAFLAYQDQLPTWDNIISAPKTATVPTTAGACAVLVFGAISKVTKETISPFMQYLERFEAEWQATFCISISKHPTKQEVALGSPQFIKWCSDNQDIL